MEVKILIQSKTLEALNYFLDEEIKTTQEDLEGSKGDIESTYYYKGVLEGLKVSKMWINSGWVDQNE